MTMEGVRPCVGGREKRNEPKILAHAVAKISLQQAGLTWQIIGLNHLFYFILATNPKQLKNDEIYPDSLSTFQHDRDA